MKVIGNVSFVTIGVKSPQELSLSNPVIYSSDSLISSLNYAGGSDIIMRSTTFSNEFKKKLSEINGHFSLGTTNGVMKNAHIYSRNAKHLDGIERLCYISQEGQYLVVSEYHGNRGAKYSALYKLLRNALHEKGFTEVQGKICIPEDDLDVFVRVVNEIIDDRANNRYSFQGVDVVDSILIKGVKYFYYKAFWINSSENNNECKQEDLLQIDHKLREVANFSVACSDVDLLVALLEKIQKIDKLIADRIKNLTILKEF